MADTHVEIVTPGRTLFSGDAEMLICRTAGGEIAFLANHMPYIGVLEPGLVRIVGGETPGGELLLAVHGGFVEVKDNQVIMLADVAERPEEIDVARARKAAEAAGGVASVPASDGSASAGGSAGAASSSGGDAAAGGRSDALARAQLRIEVAGT